MNKYGPFITGDKVKLPKEVIELLNAQKPSKITDEITFATPESNDNEGVINTSEVIEHNEIPKNSSNVLSGKGLQKASGTRNETDEEQTSSKDKEKRTE
jgi:hypothetical protein